MSEGPSRRVVFGVLGAAVVLMLTVTAVLFTREIARIREEKARRSEIMGEVPDFSLTDQTGRRVGRSDLLGKVTLVGFMFTRCSGPCGDLTSQMARLQSDWREIDDVQLVSISVDPTVDTRDVLAGYASRAGAIDGKWMFLTGEEDRVVDLVKKGFRAPIAPSVGEHEILHSERFAVVDRVGRIRAYIDGKSEDVVMATRPIVRRLMAEN